MQKFEDIATIIGPPGLIPVVGVNVTVYDHGTSTTSHIYSDNSSTVTANPLTTDSSGRYYFYAADGRYDLTVSGAGIQTTTLTDITLSGEFTQSGTGAVGRTVQAKLREIEVSLADFGTLGNSSTGDDAVWQLALDYISDLPSGSPGVQGVLVLPRGAIYLATTVKFGPNTAIRGKGLRFANQVLPLASFSGTSLFEVDGANVTGGSNFYVSFENFLVDESLVNAATVPVCFKFLNAYSCVLDNVYVHNGVGKLVTVQSCNDFKAIKPRLFGLDTASCTHGIHVISDSSVTIVSPDIEVCGAGIQQDGNSRVTVLGGYGERNTRAWYNNGSTSGNMEVHGGQWEGVNAGTIAAEIKGGNCTVIGGRYTANGGSGLLVNQTSRPVNAKILGVSGDINDTKNYAWKEVTDTTNWYEAKARNYKIIPSLTTTAFYTIEVPFLSSHQAAVDVFINARDNAGYTQYTANYRFSCNNNDGTLRATPITEYAKATVASSANYSLTVSTVVTTTGPTTLAFQITASSGGVLGAGQSPRIATEARMTQYDPAGAVYMQTA